MILSDWICCVLSEISLENSSPIWSHVNEQENKRCICLTLSLKDKGNWNSTRMFKHTKFKNAPNDLKATLTTTKSKILHIYLLPVSLGRIFHLSLYDHPFPCWFHFETSALYDPKITWNTTSSKVPNTCVTSISGSQLHSVLLCDKPF